MAKRNKKDIAWEKILENTEILKEIDEHGCCYVTSEELKQKGNLEPRILCKIDTKDDEPIVFKQHKISILATKNKRYRISKVNPFLNIDRSLIKSEPDKVFFLRHKDTLSLNNISSETQALLIALESDMIKYVLGETPNLTIQGRHYSEKFTLSLPIYDSSNVDIFDVEGVQFEVDGGFESENKIGLFEFKLKIVDTITIRQVIYPLLHYKQSSNKEVLSYLIMVEAEKGFYHIFPVCYNENSIYIIHEEYRMYAVRPSLTDFDNLYNVQVGEYGVGNVTPFPQADNLSTVIEVFNHIGLVKNITKEDLFHSYDLVPRQWDYYVNAVIYLGLGRKSSNNHYELTALGREVYKLKGYKQFFAIAQIIVSDPVFNTQLHNDTLILTEKTLRDIRHYSDDTVKRRAQTVKSWIDFLNQSLSL